MSIAENAPGGTVWVVYDLTDRDQWQQAREDRAAWGRGLSDIHRLDVDHILIVFYAGGELRQNQAAA